MAKRFDPSQRLNELLKEHNSLRFKLAELSSKFGVAEGERSAPTFALAEIGRTIEWTLGDADTELKTLFRETRLRPENPLSWQILLRLFAIAHFRPKAKKGRRKSWGSDELCRLLKDVAEVKQRNPSLSDEAICKALAAPRKKYDCSGPTLRRRLQDARNINKNALLNAVYKDVRKIYRAHHPVEQLDALAQAEAIKILAKKPPQLSGNRSHIFRSTIR